MDINKALRTAISTGKVYFGIEETKKALKKGEAKLVILSSNCPSKFFEDINSSKKITTYNFNGTNIELGSACGKPFPISILTVVKPGKSNIMQLK
jgi:large subunit ribosomal protein L30e